MKNLLLLFIPLLIACSSVKDTETALNTGNYDQAINIALKNLQTNKHKKGKQPYVIMLESAYKKATNRDLSRIDYLEKTNNDAQVEEIYNLYQLLKRRQEKIKPVLPLPIHESSRNAQFKFTNYTQNILDVKERLANFLYVNAKKSMVTSDKLKIRQAYGDFKYLEDVYPNYKDTRKLMDQTHQRGTDFVIVNMKNETRMVIPERLEEDLLNFSTYKLNDLWTVYHNNKIKNINYDFDMQIKLRDILISPEQVKEKQILKEKKILDGKTTLLDGNGNVEKDSLGNAIKIDKFKTIVCEINEFMQFKSVKVNGQVFYKNLKTKQLLDTFPLESEFVFEHSYATYNGNKSALDTNYLSLIKLRSVPFPNNEQMIFDAGEDLKLRLKSIITNQNFR